MQNELVIGLSEATYGPTVANSQEPDHHCLWLEKVVGTGLREARSGTSLYSLQS